MTQTKTNLTLELMRHLGGKNACFSPLSIRLALGMLSDGAEGETKQQLDALINGVQNPVSDGVMQVANSVWTGNFEVNQTYAEKILMRFGALAHKFNQKDPAKAAEQINAYIASCTLGQIDSLIQPDDIDDLTVFILLNALAFHGKWQNPFDVALTRDGIFHGLSGEVNTSYMHQEADLNAYEDGLCRAVKLNYEEGYTFEAIMSGEHSETKLDTLLAYALSGLNYTNQKARLYLPKFKLRTNLDLKSNLMQLGVTRIFNASSAELSQIHPNPLLEVSKVVHEATIDVDEEGTVAAAATAVIGRLRSARPKLPIFNFNQPFIFLIRKEGQVIFAGQFVDAR